MLLDRFLPVYDVAERHRVLVRAPPEVTYAAARGVDVARAPTVRLLFWLRGLPGRLGRGGSTGPMTLDAFLRSGFVLLAEEPGHEVVLGVVGRFWRPAGDVVRVEAEAFTGFDRAGYAKAAWSIRVVAEGASTVLSTETRAAANDPGARRRLKAYWALIRPFSGWVRRRMLALAKADAEWRAGGADGAGRGPS